MRTWLQFASPLGTIADFLNDGALDSSLNFPLEGGSCLGLQMFLFVSADAGQCALTASSVLMVPHLCCQYAVKKVLNLLSFTSTL